MKEAWYSHTVKKHWERPTLIDFNDWLKEKAETHERLKVVTGKSKDESPASSGTRTKTSSKAFPSNSKTEQHPTNAKGDKDCVVCKNSHPLWQCPGFREKTPTQRAKIVAENSLCFTCLGSNHTFRKCQKQRKCRKKGCKGSHNTLLHGAEWIFPPRSSISEKNQSNRGNPGNHGNTNNESELSGQSSAKHPWLHSPTLRVSYKLSGLKSLPTMARRWKRLLCVTQVAAIRGWPKVWLIVFVSQAPNIV